MLLHVRIQRRGASDFFRSARNFMRTSLFILFLLAATPGVAQDAELVTRFGRHVSKAMNVTVEVSKASATHINFTIAFKSKIPNPSGGGRSVEVTSSVDVKECAVSAGAWAFCITREDEIWFYDGDRLFTRLHNTPDAIRKSATCSEPNLGEQAPEALKKWIQKKVPNKSAPAAPAQRCSFQIGRPWSGVPERVVRSDMEFTALEQAVLDWIASHADVANLAEQIAACRPTERDLTGVGSYTKLAVPADKPRIERPRAHSPVHGPWIDGTEGIHLGGSSLLFLDETGYIRTLELVANGDHFDKSATGFVLHAYTEPGAALR